jgi:hypothetical protein
MKRRTPLPDLQATRRVCYGGKGLALGNKCDMAQRMNTITTTSPADGLAISRVDAKFAAHDVIGY